ncbi:MAG: DnaJ C-terminal domain-containing protein [Dehalococcoidia bacterium]
MAKKSYYDILGVPKDASQKEIQGAFRRLAREYHPDVNPGNKEAEAKFKEINEAYELLSSPEARSKYDRSGQGISFEEIFGRGRGPFVWRFESGSFSPEGEFDFASSAFDDILRGFMGGRGRRPFEEALQSRRRASVEYSVEVSLEEAYSGTTRMIEVAGDAARGQKPRRLEVKVPPGVMTGTRIRVSPNGHIERGVGEVETVYLVVTVKPHKDFQRRGDDLYVEAPVPLLDAVLGGEVKVRMLNGRVSLKIPPSTQNGRTFRLGGKGMPRLGESGKGNLYVKARVVLPADLTEEERGLFKTLKDMREKRGV